jgi:acyl carrier protein
MLTHEELWCRVQDALALPRGDVGPDAPLDGDLGFDSLSMAELVVLLDELGAPVPDGLVASIATVGDVYTLYRNHLEAVAP